MSTDALNWSHQRHIFNPHHARPVTVLGCGAVGSQAILLLAKCGVQHITVYDADDVSSPNLPMSLAFGPSDLGRRKVDVVQERVHALAGLEITTIPRMYAGEEINTAVLSCVDTMEARMEIWKQVRLNPRVDLFVDTRTDALCLSLFVLRPCMPEDMAYYEAHLYPTNLTVMRTCGNHGIAYQSMIAASLAVRALTAHWNGDTPRRHERVLLGEDGTHLIT